MENQQPILDTIDPEITGRLVSRRDVLRRGAGMSSRLAAGLALGSVPVALAALSRDVFAQTPADIVDVVREREHGRAREHAEPERAEEELVDFPLHIQFVLGVTLLIVGIVRRRADERTPVATPVAGPAPAGWYAAPEGTGRRYWDGARWTEHTSP